MIKVSLSRLLTIVSTAIALGMGFITMLNACRAGNTLYIVISAVVLGIETVLLQFLISDTKNNKEEEKARRSDLEFVQLVFNDVYTELELSKKMGQEMSYGEVMDRIEVRYNQYKEE